MKHPETTAGQAAPRLRAAAIQASLTAEIMALAAEVSPNVTAHVVTLSTNSVLRYASVLRLPHDTLDEILAIPMPRWDDRDAPAHWGETSATLWAAMRAARTPTAGRQ